MSQLGDAIKALSDKQAASEAIVVTLLQDTRKTLTDLAAKIAAGGVQQSDIDAINAQAAKIQGTIDSLTALDTTVKIADQ